jgi:hypothetical protein
MDLNVHRVQMQMQVAEEERERKKKKKKKIGFDNWSVFMDNTKRVGSVVANPIQTAFRH